MTSEDIVKITQPRPRLETTTLSEDAFRQISHRCPAALLLCGGVERLWRS